ncbi:MAG: hypothetical protein MJZ81_07170 [Bacteroidales bacterium]|nr:hypothetical protein [Bacteroidales bacterium]
MECYRCPLKPVIDAFVASDSLKAFSSKRRSRDGSSSPHPFAHLVQPIADALSAVCLKCSATSDDDNLSHHGQTFVSIDSTIESPSGRRTGSSASEFILSQRSPDAAAPAYGRFDDSFDRPPPSDASSEDETSRTTGLPASVEDALKRQFANFRSLSVLDLCLLSHMLSGGSLASFASMSWLPRLPYDPTTLQPIPITRQAAHARFRSICRRIPVLAVLASSSAPCDPASFDPSVQPPPTQRQTRRSAPPAYDSRRLGRASSVRSSSAALDGIRAKSASVRKNHPRPTTPPQPSLFDLLPQTPQPTDPTSAPDPGHTSP